MVVNVKGFRAVLCRDAVQQVAARHGKSLELLSRKLGTS